MPLSRSRRARFLLPEEQLPSDDVKKGEIVLENGEVSSGRWRKGELENGELSLKNGGKRRMQRGLGMGISFQISGEEANWRGRRYFEENRERRILLGKSSGRRERLHQRAAVQMITLLAVEISLLLPPRGVLVNCLPVEGRVSLLGGIPQAKRISPRVAAQREMRSWSQPRIRKYHGEYNHTSGSKCWRLSVDDHSSSHSEKLHSRLSVEKYKKFFFINQSFLIWQLRVLQAP